MTGIARQQFSLNYFSEGTIPGLFISPGDANMSPNQVRELQDSLNAIAGDQAWKHKIIVLPGGSKVDPQKPNVLADAFDQIVMLQTCMAFDCSPIELGILPNVSATTTASTISMVNKAQQQIHQRKSTVPLLEWLKNAVFDVILQDVLGQEDMEWRWEGLEEAEDEEALTATIVEQVGAGLASIDEGRMELGREPWGLPITQDPGWATQFGGYQSLTALAAMTSMGPGTQGQQAQETSRDPGAGSREMPGELPPTGMAAQPRNSMSHRQRGQHATTIDLASRVPGAATPAHSGAAAAHAQTRRAGGRAAKESRELDLLRAHLRRGSQVRDWQPRELPGYVMAMLTEDLGKGLTPDEACDLAAGALAKAPGGGSRPWAPPPAVSSGGTQRQQPSTAWQGWYADSQLAAEYARQLAAAISAAVNTAVMAAQWLTRSAAHRKPPGPGRTPAAYAPSSAPCAAGMAAPACAARPGTGPASAAARPPARAASLPEPDGRPGGRQGCRHRYPALAVGRGMDRRLGRGYRRARDRPGPSGRRGRT